MIQSDIIANIEREMRPVLANGQMERLHETLTRYIVDAKRALISQRVKEALARIRSEGRVRLGRPPGAKTAEGKRKLDGKTTELLKLLGEGKPVAAIARELCVDRGTVYRRCAEMKLPKERVRAVRPDGTKDRPIEKKLEKGVGLRGLSWDEYALLMQAINQEP